MGVAAKVVLSGNELASLAQDARENVGGVTPLSPEKYRRLPPAVLEKVGSSYDIVDGFHRLAGLAEWAERNGVEVDSLEIEVVIATDSSLIADAAEPGPKQETALREIYRQAGIKY